MVVLKAVHYPIQNSDLYKDAKVQVDATWLQSINNIGKEHRELLSGT